MYVACPSCEEMKSKGLIFWRSLYDTTDCFQLSTIVYDHSRKYISDAEAIERLSRFDLEKLLPNDTDTKRYLTALVENYTAPEPVVEMEVVVEEELPKKSTRRHKDVEA